MVMLEYNTDYIIILLLKKYMRSISCPLLIHRRATTEFNLHENLPILIKIREVTTDDIEIIDITSSKFLSNLLTRTIRMVIYIK